MKQRQGPSNGYHCSIYDPASDNYDGLRCCCLRLFLLLLLLLRLLLLMLHQLGLDTNKLYCCVVSWEDSKRTVEDCLAKQVSNKLLDHRCETYSTEM